MEPNFKTIADLFAAPQIQEPDFEEVPRKKHGQTAEESDALGSQHLIEGNLEEAIRHFKEAVAQRKPGDITSQMNLAGAFEYGDQTPQAVRQYQMSLRAHNDAAEPHVGLSDAFRRYGRFTDAVKELEEAIVREPENPFFRIKLAETLRDAGFPKKALQAAQGAVIAKPDEAFYHYWLGDHLIDMKQDEDALASLRAAIELSPGDDHLFLRVAVPFWRLGRRAEAVKSVRLASDLDPNKHLYYGLLGIMLEEMDQMEEAQLESARAEKMDRYDHERLARIMAEMGIEA